ncbi:MAG: hypothetical protein R3293_20630 [Candidatus Promineifilaceae bacterium]|nr:hypothetical protein [Candidatus Promineifilaceae bacterium]
MSQDKEFKELARKAYISYHQDGLIDILIGVGIIGFAFMMLTGNVVFNMLAWMPVLLYVPIKKRITIPRFGYVQFTSKEKRHVQLLIGLIVGILFLAFFLGLYFFIASGSMPPALFGLVQRYDLLLLGFLLAIPMILGGALTGLSRFYAYAVLTLVIIGTGIFLGIDAPYYVLLLGLAILMVGINLMIRFLRKYPLPDEES